jgi:membrane protein YqaA with SNARE-associated domain
MARGRRHSGCPLTGVAENRPTPPAVPEVTPPTTPVWVWPAVLTITGLLALVGAALDGAHDKLWTLLPYTYLGNSLAPLPYDGMLVWLGSRAPLWQVVVVGTIGTVLVEFWNMELLRRILARDGTRGFRRHKLTRGMLVLFNKFPFLTLVGTCILPIIPHYPMRLLAVLARYPMWKYQTSVIIGRSGRYIWLGLLGTIVPVPTWLLVAVSLTVLWFGWRHAKKMNADGDAHADDADATMGEAAAAAVTHNPAVSPPI